MSSVVSVAALAAMVARRAYLREWGSVALCVAQCYSLRMSGMRRGMNAAGANIKWRCRHDHGDSSRQARQDVGDVQ